MTSRLARMAAALVLAGGAGLAAAGTPTYGPFHGAAEFIAGQGYQELELSADRWYVAYQGNRDTGSAWVDAAWAVRSAQLCATVGATAFVELRYPFEQVASDDPGLAMSGATAGDEHADLQPVAAVFIPIYIPQQPVPMTPLEAPAKLAAIRCLKDIGTLKDATRATTSEAAYAKAKTLGIAVTP